MNFDKPTNWQKDRNWNDKLSHIWQQKGQELVFEGNLLGFIIVVIWWSVSLYHGLMMRFYRRGPILRNFIKVFPLIITPLFSHYNLFNFIGKRWGKKVDYILCQKKKNAQRFRNHGIFFCHARNECRQKILIIIFTNFERGEGGGGGHEGEKIFFAFLDELDHFKHKIKLWFWLWIPQYPREKSVFFKTLSFLWRDP